MVEIIVQEPNKIAEVHIWQEEITEIEDSIQISATIENPDASRLNLWYRLPSEFRPLITENCDSFVVATIFRAMSQSANLVVHGEVSPSLLQNLAEFQTTWASWLPHKYQIIDVIPEIEREQITTQNRERAIATFSGGVDSCFTMYRHRTGSCERLNRQIEAALMVHGFDIPLEQKEVFERAAKRSQKMLSSLEVQLIPITTNYREIEPRLLWEDVFGTALVSCLMLLQKGFNIGLIPSSFPYNALSFPYGSNPVTDWMLSSQNFRIIHDGAASTRLEKIRKISEWKEALKYLRVCWEGSQKDTNCCRCEKCVRNILNFRVLGIDSPECFEKELKNHHILELKMKGGALDSFQRTIKAAKAAGISDSWVTSAEVAVRRNQFRNALIRHIPNKLKDKLRAN
jgi:hypothetical protein